MKKALLVILNSLFFILSVLGQSVPGYFNYQGVARQTNGLPITNTAILVRFSIIPLAPTGTVEYAEFHSVTTDAFGMFTAKIGAGTPVSGIALTNYRWDKDKYIKIEIDPDGNTNGVSYTDLGTTQLLSVPYALQADQAYSLSLPQDLVAEEDFSLFKISNLSSNTVSEPMVWFYSQNQPSLRVSSQSGTALTAYSASGIGAEFHNSNGATTPAMRVTKSSDWVAINSNIAEIEGNSGGNNSQLLLGETEADYARLSFASSYSTSGSNTDLWTLAGKTDAQTNANSRFHIYRTGTGNILSATGTGNVGIGNSDPTSKLEVAGQVKITGGGPGNGKVLTSDANGLASWQTISGTGFVLPFDQTYNNSNTTAFIVRNNDGTAISGISLDGNGVLGQSSTNYGVDGFSSSNAGISGRSQTGIGGRFISQSGPALVTAGGNVGLGTSSPTAQLEVAGQVKITGGNPGANKVLTSDANGLATWVTPSGGGGLTLPYSGSAYSAQGFAAFTVNATGTGQSGVAISGVNESSPMGSGIQGFDNNQTGPGGNGVYGFSHAGTGGFFSSNIGYALTTGYGNVGIGTLTPSAQLDVNGQIKIRGGNPGSGKVLTSDANGLATWQTPSGGGGGGQWSNTTGGIYNTDLTNVGIGTSLPYAKLHVEGGQIFFTGNINDVLRVTGTGTDLSAVGIQALNGTGLNTNAKIGIDAQGSEIAVKAVSTATSGGAGLSAESYSGTGAAVIAKNTHYSGVAFKIENGGVADTGGKWSFQVSVNPGDLSVIHLFYPSPLPSDMIYVQAIGSGNGGSNNYLSWNTINGSWDLLPATGSFDGGLTFNVMVIHAQ